MARAKIDGVKVVSVDDKCALVTFDASWDDSWRNDTNCDAIWVFGKFSAGAAPWRHMSLAAASGSAFNYRNQAPQGFSAGSMGGLGVWVPQEKKGFFVFRAEGKGDVRSQGLTLAWDYKADGLSKADVQKMPVKLFCVEMTYIAPDKHYVGDPIGADGPRNCLYTYPDKGAYLVSTEDAILVDAKDGCLYCDQDNERSRDEVPFTIPATFPKGVNEFWYMKYGLNSQQYVDFLNTLTRKQQQAHVRSDISTDVITNNFVMTNTINEKFRSSVVCVRKGNGTTEPVRFYTYAPARACNAIAWRDVAGYAAWAGLRPVTDFEFEKACRGPLPAVAWECAWGSNEIGRVETFDGADGSGLEKKVPQTGLVNACYNSGIAPFEEAAGKKDPDNPAWEGPVTCGLFSFTRHEGIPKRLNDGAGYYGNTELSGNLWEPVVTFGHPAGRAFRPIRGAGMLDENGLAQVETWPDQSGAGAGARGGVYRSPDATYLAVALRFAGSHPKADPRFNGGIRVGF